MLSRPLRNALKMGGLGAALSIGAIALVYFMRLWWTGFPTKDVRVDLLRFPIQAAPAAVVSAALFALTSLQQAVSPLKSKFSVTMIVLALAATCGTIIANWVLPIGADRSWQHEIVALVLAPLGAMGVVFAVMLLRHGSRAGSVQTVRRSDRE